MHPSKTHHPHRSDRPANRRLRLDKETVRALNPSDLIHVQGGCPFASTTTTTSDAAGGRGHGIGGIG